MTLTLESIISHRDRGAPSKFLDRLARMGSALGLFALEVALSAACGVPCTSVVVPRLRVDAGGFEAPLPPGSVSSSLPATPRSALRPGSPIPRRVLTNPLFKKDAGNQQRRSASILALHHEEQPSQVDLQAGCPRPSD